jgi:WD40 repeat protein
MAVGSESGEAQILNLRSGGVLYDLPNSGKEITCLRFLENAQTKLWLCGGGWDGKAYFWTEPGPQNKFQVSVSARTSHHGDILCIDCSSSTVVTGGTDGYVSVYNILSGVFKTAIPMPSPKPRDGNYAAAGD